MPAAVNATTGRIEIASGSIAGFNEEGVLLYLVAELVAAGTSPLAFEFFDFDEGSTVNGTINGSITVQAPVAPVWVNELSDVSVSETDSVTFVYSATDQLNRTVVYEMTEGPENATFNEETGEFKWNTVIGDRGEYTVTVTATSPEGQIATTSTTITVNPTKLARAQVIHNSADPAAAVVDVYANGALFIEGFEFRSATAFVDLPAEVDITLDIYGSGADISEADPVYTVTVSLEEAETYTLIATGVVAGGFSANPNEIDTDFFIDIISGTLESYVDGNDLALLIYHGSTDAPGVDVYARNVALLAENLEYTDISDYLAVPQNDYIIDIHLTGSPNSVAAFTAPLSEGAGLAITVLASGFLSPAENNGGEAFGLLAVFADGTTIMLPAAELPYFRTDWQRALVSQNLPEWFGADTERGMAFGNDEVYVVSRNAGISVRVLDANNGDDKGVLNVEGVAGGLFPLNAIGVTDDGVIIASNMTLNASTAPFTFYHWNSHDTAPVQNVTEVTDAVRLGDKITVTGSVANGTAQVWAVSATATIANVYIWTMDGGMFNSSPVVISLSDNVTGGAAVAEPMLDGSFWLTYNGAGIKKYDSTGQLSGTIPTSVVATGSNSMSYIGLSDDGDHLLAVFTYGAGNENARIVRIPGSELESATIEGVTPALRSAANGNGAGDVALRYNDDNSYTVFVLSTNNGVGAYSTLGGVIQDPVFNTNRAPVFVSFIDQADAFAGQEFSFTFEATDADDDELTYSLLFAPMGAEFDETTGVFTWTPAADTEGDFVVAVSVTDGNLLTPVTSVGIISVTIPITLYDVKFEVYMELADGFNPETQMVYIAGDLPGVTSWETPGSNPALALTRANANSPYSITLALPEGNIAYKFFANNAGQATWDNGEWGGDPNRTAVVTADTTIKHLYGVRPGDTIDISDARTLPVGAPVWVRGISTTPDFGPSNRAEFFMQDATAGIKVTWFGFGGFDSDVFAAGQDVEIHGTLRVFGNQLEIGPWANIIHSSGNDLPEPVVINNLEQWAVDSPLQGMRVRVDDMILPDSQTWPTDAFTSSGISRNITGITGSVFQDQQIVVRLARFNNFWNGSPRPQGAFNMIGALGRFNADPQLFPFFESDITRATSIDDVVVDIPMEYTLFNNFPNPFNPTTNIRFALPESGQVMVEVYNVMGQRVATLVNAEMAAGTHTVTFNAANLASGTYIVRMQSGNFNAIQKMMLVK